MINYQISLKNNSQFTKSISNMYKFPLLSIILIFKYRDFGANNKLLIFNMEK